MNQAAGRSGFTLIEVLMAIMVFTIGILGLLTLQMVSARGVAAGAEATCITALAQRYMEEIAGAPFDAPGLTDSNPANNLRLDSMADPDHSNQDAYGNVAVFPGYRMVINVAADHPVQNSKTIVVLVGSKSGRRTRKFCTIKSLSQEGRN